MSSNKLSSEQLLIPFALEDKASFSNFYVGSNAELVEALRTMSDSNKDRIIYFYGGSGAGKSHLLFAVLKQALEKAMKAQYLSLADSRVTAELLDATDASAFVCIDDVNSWAGQDSKERGLFALYERIKQSGGVLLVSSTQAPEKNGFKLADLVSRLSSGLVYPLYGLNDEQRFEAIRLRAEQRGMSISDETVRYLLSRSARDSKQVFSLLDKIDRASLIEKRRITVPFLQSILS